MLGISWKGIVIVRAAPGSASEVKREEDKWEALW